MPIRNAERCPGLDGGSVSALSVDAIDRVRLARRDEFPLAAMLVLISWFSASELPPIDTQRLRGGGCSEKPLVTLSLLVVVGVGSVVTHWTGWRSDRIFRSIRRSIVVTGPDSGKLRTAGGPKLEVTD